MKKLLLLSLLLLALSSVLGQPSYSSYDTIPARYKGYHYTEWYDECPAYNNGGMIDSCNYEEYYVYASVGGIVKYEYTDHPVIIKGLVAMVSPNTIHLYPHIHNTLGENYLYLLKRIDWVDTINPSPMPGMFRMKVLDSVRFDTVKPKIMTISQAYNGISDQFVYAYEAYFEKPIVVDSVFYVYGTDNHYYVQQESGAEVFSYWPFSFAEIRPQPHWLGCGNSHYEAYCQPQGHYNSLAAFQYWDASALGYPRIEDPWCRGDWHYPDDPYGLFLAIVDHYELELFSDNYTMGDVEGNGFYDENELAVIKAIPNPGFAFSHWNDGNTQNPRSLFLTQDTSFTAYFSRADDLYLHLTANNPQWGTVDGEGYYPANSSVTISATPNNGFLFDRWSDGDWQNPRVITLTQDTSLTAIFDIDPTGIETTADRYTYVMPNPASGNVTVASSFRIGDVELLDLNGKSHLRTTVDGLSAALDISSLPAGTYIVRITTSAGTAYKKLVVK